MHYHGNPLPHSLIKHISHHRKLRRLYNYYRYPLLKSLLNRIIKELRLALHSFYYFKFHKSIAVSSPHDNTFCQHLRKYNKRKNNIEILKTSTSTLILPSDIANSLGTHFSNTFATHNLTDSHTNAEVNSFISSLISTAELPVKYISPLELSTIINHLKPTLTVGSDGLNNFILKRLPINMITLLCALFNSCLRLEFFSDNWKIAHIIPIFKPNSFPTSTDSYCPISLLSPLGKLFEKFLKTRLFNFLNYSNLIATHQFGFSHKLSAPHPPLILSNTIITNFHSRGLTALVSLDIKKSLRFGLAQRSSF